MIIAFVNTMTKQKSLLKGHKLFYMSHLDTLFSQMIQMCLGKKNFKTKTRFLEMIQKYMSCIDT